MADVVEPGFILKCKLEIPLENAESMEVFKEFPAERVAAMYSMLAYELEISRMLFGSTLEEAQKNLQLLQAFHIQNDKAILCERSWIRALRFIDEAFLSPECGQDDVTVVFRIEMGLEDCAKKTSAEIWDHRAKDAMRPFRLFADIMMNGFLEKLQGSVEGHFHGNSGWLQLSKKFLVEEFKKNEMAFINPIEHQVECMRTLLVGFNQTCGTHWYCPRASKTQQTTNPLIKKKRHDEWVCFVKMNSDVTAEEKEEFHDRLPRLAKRGRVALAE